MKSSVTIIYEIDKDCMYKIFLIDTGSARIMCKMDNIN